MLLVLLSWGSSSSMAAVPQDYPAHMPRVYSPFGCMGRQDCSPATVAAHFKVPVSRSPDALEVRTDGVAGTFLMAKPRTLLEIAQKCSDQASKASSRRLGEDAGR